jgi:hypothetical protein
MKLPQRHREHGVRIRKEEIHHRNSGIRNIFKSELRALCVSVVIPFPSVSSFPSAFSLPPLRPSHGGGVERSSTSGKFSKLALG